MGSEMCIRDSLQTAEILAFRPLRGTPSSRHLPLYDRNAFHRGCKVGVVISSDFCWGGSNSFGGASKRGRFGVLHSSAVPLEKKNVREKSTMGPSYAAICANLAYITGQRSMYLEVRSMYAHYSHDRYYRCHHIDVGTKISK